MLLQCKRIYLPFAESDGKRVLVDRLWPRALTRDRAKIDVWLKDIAPSPLLRKFFAHDPARFAEFQKRYVDELNTDVVHQQSVESVLSWLKREPVTLLYAAKDEVHNHAVVLTAFLRDRLT